MSNEIVRFSRGRRIEHFVTMTLFTLLVVTGLPQKFFDTSWARGIVWLFGGLDTLRWVHRLSGFAFTAAAVVHLTGALWSILRGASHALALVPTGKDFRDAVQQLRYYLGLSEHQAQFDRYDYRQKFEYWGLIVGSVIMTVTGFILFWPTKVADVLPGEVIPAAKLAHSNEGLLAFLTILIWHIYNAHLNPDVFPFDKTIFTGKISRERMEHEHPLELARMEGRPDEAPSVPHGERSPAGEP